MDDLFWHCVKCGAHEAVEPTGGEPYVRGDKEKCIDCGEAYAVVMTLKEAAELEQLNALGRDPNEVVRRIERDVR